jgi:hypothetical protein
LFASELQCAEGDDLLGLAVVEQLESERWGPATALSD